MKISSINAEAARQVNRTIKLFPGRVSLIPRTWYFGRFISMLTENSQPFHPRREGMPGTETIFQHTLKDMIVLRSFLLNRPEQIKIDEITFPPRNADDPCGALKRMAMKSRAVFDLAELAMEPQAVRLLDVFVLYHDIAKRTGDRKDHEEIGAEYFMKAQSTSASS